MIYLTYITQRLRRGSWSRVWAAGARAWDFATGVQEPQGRKPYLLGPYYVFLLYVHKNVGYIGFKYPAPEP